MSKENKTSDKPQNGNDFIADVSNSTALEKPTPENTDSITNKVLMMNQVDGCLKVVKKPIMKH